MEIYRPLRAGLFFYDVSRLLLLVIIIFIVPEGSGFPFGSYESGILFPHVVFLSANSLFPLMALFLWLNLEEHKNYLSLYIAGKIIGTVSFYAWELFSLGRSTWALPGLGIYREFSGIDSIINSVALLGGSMFISLADIFSVWGAWTIKNKLKKRLVRVPDTAV